METNEIAELFKQGIDCSQVVAGELAELLSMDKGLLRKMSACFGGGMMLGETCGAVTGALMVIGLKYGHNKEGDAETKSLMQEKVNAFYAKYHEKYESTICKEILGHDISKPGEMEEVLREGSLFTLCPSVVSCVIEILKKDIL